VDFAVTASCMATQSQKSVPPPLQSRLDYTGPLATFHEPGHRRPQKMRSPPRCHPRRNHDGLPTICRKGHSYQVGKTAVNRAIWPSSEGRSRLRRKSSSDRDSPAGPGDDVNADRAVFSLEGPRRAAPGRASCLSSLRVRVPCSTCDGERTIKPEDPSGKAMARIGAKGTKIVPRCHNTKLLRAEEGQ